MTCRKLHDRLMASRKYYLKLYSVALGVVVSFASFLWIAVLCYVLSHTDSRAKELLMARYLDISIGLLAFTSALALQYGAFVESRSWLSVWTIGSFTVIITAWSFFFVRKYGSDGPESLKDTQTTLLCLSAVYVLSTFPVLAYYRLLESNDVFLKPCKRQPAMSSLDYVVIGGNVYVRERVAQIQVAVKDEDLYNPV